MRLTWAVAALTRAGALVSVAGGGDTVAALNAAGVAEDFTFISKVYEALYPSKPDFGFDDVLALLKKQPCLVEINRKFQRNEGSKIN